MDHIGIDVHKKESQICILAEGGELIERRIRTEPRRFAEALSERASARILLESATESEWVARCPEALAITSSWPTRTSPQCTPPAPAEHSEHNIRSQSRPAASRPDAGVGTADSPLAQRG